MSAILRERRIQFAGHSCRAKQEFAIDLLFWAQLHRARRGGRPAFSDPGHIYVMPHNAIIMTFHP